MPLPPSSRYPEDPVGDPADAEDDSAPAAAVAAGVDPVGLSQQAIADDGKGGGSRGAPESRLWLRKRP